MVGESYISNATPHFIVRVATPVREAEGACGPGHLHQEAGQLKEENYAGQRYSAKCAGEVARVGAHAHRKTPFNTALVCHLLCMQHEKNFVNIGRAGRRLAHAFENCV